MAASVKESAWTPAPPVGSAAAKARNDGRGGLAAKYRRWMAGGSPLGMMQRLYCNSSQPMTEKQEFKNWDVLDLRLISARRGSRRRDTGGDPAGRTYP